MRKKVFRILAALLVIFAALSWAAPAATLGIFSRYLLVAQPPQKADAIVVLLGGREPDRILKAIELLKADYAPKIAFASGFIDPEVLKNAPPQLVWLRSSDEYVTALKSLGISSENILVVPGDGAYDTSTELGAIAEYAAENHWQKVLLVSSPSHMRRVSIIWRRVSTGTEGIAVPSDHPGFAEWWKYGHHRRALAYEYLSLVKEAFNQCKHALRTLRS